MSMNFDFFSMGKRQYMFLWAIKDEKDYIPISEAIKKILFLVNFDISRLLFGLIRKKIILIEGGFPAYTKDFSLNPKVEISKRYMSKFITEDHRIKINP